MVWPIPDNPVWSMQRRKADVSQPTRLPRQCRIHLTLPESQFSFLQLPHGTTSHQLRITLNLEPHQFFAPVRRRPEPPLPAGIGSSAPTPPPPMIGQNDAGAADLLCSLRFLRHQFEPYTASAAVGSCSARIAVGGRKPCRSMSRGALQASRNSISAWRSCSKVSKLGPRASSP